MGDSGIIGYIGISLLAQLLPQRKTRRKKKVAEGEGRGVGAGVKQG